MKILLINPPYQTFTSNLGAGHQIPLGLLMVGGALLDAGHEAHLLDAECGHLTMEEIVREVDKFKPDIVMTGHAGSTPAHTKCMRMLRAIKDRFPNSITIYGGVYPTYHALKILADEDAVDYIVRGEGEATTVKLVEAIQNKKAMAEIPGIAFRFERRIRLTAEAAPIFNLDQFRIGWELIGNWDRYQCFGLGRAAIVQFSRGCPHQCTYCGQHGFWVQWRHRHVQAFVDEIEWLHRIHDIRFFTLADENPTTKQELWRKLLEEIIARKLPIHFFATIRATDIVRDAEILPLYRQAGILYILMGIETTSAETIKKIKKGSTTRHDLQACRLLRKNRIFSILGYIVGLKDDTWKDFRKARSHLREYDGDYLNAMYVTPHSWTQFAHEVHDRCVIQLDQEKWDYRHQILSQEHLKPWQIFACVKWLELRFQCEPKKLWRLIWDSDFERRQRRWTLFHTGRVWLAEIGEFLWATSFSRHPAKLRDVQGVVSIPVRSRQKTCPTPVSKD